MVKVFWLKNSWQIANYSHKIKNSKENELKQTVGTSIMKLNICLGILRIGSTFSIWEKNKGDMNYEIGNFRKK